MNKGVSVEQGLDFRYLGIGIKVLVIRKIITSRLRFSVFNTYAEQLIRHCLIKQERKPEEYL